MHRNQEGKENDIGEFESYKQMTQSTKHLLQVGPREINVNFKLHWQECYQSPKDRSVERLSFGGNWEHFQQRIVSLLIRAVQADLLMNREIPSKISEFMIMSSGYINMQRSEENRCRGKNGEGKLCRCKEGNTRKQVAWCYRVLIKNRTAFREV